MSDTATGPSRLHGTDTNTPLPNDPRQTRLQKLARVALDSIDHFVVLLDPRGTVLDVNRVALERGGIELPDVEGKPFWTTFWWQVSDEINAKLREMIGRAAKGESVRWDTEIVACAGDKETTVINAALRPVVDEGGEVAFLCAEGSDITEQVLARDEIERLRETADSASRAKEDFLAMLGHELRNPLSPIVTALELIKAQGSDRSERAYTVLERQVSHLTRLIGDLLDASQIARGNVELKIETVEISEIVGKAIEQASPLLDQRNHTLTVDVPRRGLPVNGDPLRLTQVIANLLTNAAKYTPQRGGRITVLAEDEGEVVVVRVIDTGIGIAPDVIPRVFELFAQDGRSSDRSAGGLGVGLAIVRNLVERHGGSVSARSAGRGRGSEFTVRLPRAERAGQSGAPSHARAGSPARTEGSNGQRVLVVDDNADGAEMLAAMLRYMGYEVRVAHNGPVALRLAEEFRPRIALLDLSLPVMDGYELASKLRAMPELDGLHLIAVTGYGQDSDRRKTREAGFHQHLVKPVTLEIVGTAVSAAVDGAGTSR